MFKDPSFNWRPTGCETAMETITRKVDHHEVGLPWGVACWTFVWPQRKAEGSKKIFVGPGILYQIITYNKGYQSKDQAAFPHDHLGNNSELSWYQPYHAVTNPNMPNKWDVVSEYAEYFHGNTEWLLGAKAAHDDKSGGDVSSVPKESCYTASERNRRLEVPLVGRWPVLQKPGWISKKLKSTWRSIMDDAHWPTPA